MAEFVPLLRHAPVDGTRTSIDKRREYSTISNQEDSAPQLHDERGGLDEADRINTDDDKLTDISPKCFDGRIEPEGALDHWFELFRSEDERDPERGFRR